MGKGLGIAGVIIGVILVVLIGIGLWFGGVYNSMVTAEEDVDNAWAQVENQYQRRADLIPNLVETVKGFANQEEEIFTEVARLRSQWGEAKDSGSRSDQIEAAGGLDSAISRLLLVVENYPELKSNQNFLELQAQIEGTENRISVERKRYNDSVTDFNKLIKTFPRNFIAGFFGFDEADYFEADEGADVAPAVNFNDEE
jgi:LemA protein